MHTPHQQLEFNKLATIAARVNCPYCGKLFRKSNRRHYFCQAICRSLYNKYKDTLVVFSPRPRPPQEIPLVENIQKIEQALATLLELKKDFPPQYFRKAINFLEQDIKILKKQNEPNTGSHLRTSIYKAPRL